VSQATVIVPTVVGGGRLERLLRSLDDHPGAVEVLVVDNGSADPAMDALGSRFPNARVIRLDHNAGYSRAVNLAAREATGDALVLVNDDCVCDPGFVEAIVAPLDPIAGVTMAAGVMREVRDPTRIDTAGMQLDRTLLVFDYLNGEPAACLDNGVADPIGPSGAAAAFDREAFLEMGGFDERLFAYWEDVDLVLRMRREGARCALAPRARGIHYHSATLGSGSSGKNYLTGFGRGYMLRKWGVLTRPGRTARALVTDGVVCVGQLVVDRSLAGVRGRIRGYRAARPAAPFPSEALADRSAADGALRTLARRASRRARLRAPAAPARSGKPRVLTVFHVAEVSGPLRALTNELEWLAEVGELTIVTPAAGAVTEELGDLASVKGLDFAPLMLPGGVTGAARALDRLRREVRDFRALIRRERPDLVLIVSSMLPAALIAARRERLPALVYAAEIHHGPEVASSARRLLGSALIALTGRAARAVIASSRTVAAQFPASAQAKVTVMYPPVPTSYAGGDAEGFRRRHGIASDEPCILTVGNLTPGRGQDVLLRSLPSIRSAVEGARLVIVGPTFDRPKDVAFEAELRALAGELGVSAAVTFTGYERDMAGAYAAATVFVNPSRTHPESFGIAACEALVAGRPVVATRVGAVPEVLDGVTGVALVPPGDPGSLARALVATLEDPGASSRALAGGAAIATRFTPERSLATFRRAVDGIVPIPALSDG
jgi:GT2 family glycosyltransferase/glycosyltransferase involved in cell wall biosynthesis